MTAYSTLLTIIDQHQADILEQWRQAQATLFASLPRSKMDNTQQSTSPEFLQLLAQIPHDQADNMAGQAWAEVYNFLDRISRERAERGFTSTETAIFIFSLKQPVFAVIRQVLMGDETALAETMWAATDMLDKLGLYTVEVYQQSREHIIKQQKNEIYELSTPVVQLWTEILAVPLIGTLDSMRTQTIMENVLNKIVQTSARIVIIDITGVPVVDTLVAQHLLKTAQATRLMGAECYLSGISPQIAQTIVHLGINLPDLVTRATLKEAFALALRRLNMKLVQG